MLICRHRGGKMWTVSPHRGVWRAVFIESALREKHVLLWHPSNPRGPTTLSPPCRPDARNDLVILQTAAHNPCDQMVLRHMRFFFFLFLPPKVSRKFAISSISPVLPCSLPVIKGHIIRLSCRQNDGKGLQVDWAILHLTRATTADASFVPRSVQFTGSNTLFCGSHGLFSHGND